LLFFFLSFEKYAFFLLFCEECMLYIRNLLNVLEFPQKIVNLEIKIAGTYHDEVQFCF